MDQEIIIAILAAGASSRLGSPKQLARLNGQTLIARMVQEAQSVPHHHLFVVTGAYREEVNKALDGFSFHEIWNPNFAHGIGSSLRCLHGMLTRPTHWDVPLMILACDQIFVNHQVLNDLIQSFRGVFCHSDNRQRVAAVCDYGGVLGLPVLISPRLWEDLGSLGDNEGAKKLWNAPMVHVQTISCPQAQWDIDTPEDCQIHGIQLFPRGGDLS